MLRRDPNAFFYSFKLGTFRKRRVCGINVCRKSVDYPEDAYLQLMAAQEHVPVPVADDVPKGRVWWLFEDKFYWEDEGYGEEEVRALILERRAQTEERVQAANALAGGGGTES
ncbi:MAG: hypothetical protein WC709_11875 [Thermoleophilia bacterium]